LPAVARKKVSVAFDGGMLSSDAGVLLLRDVGRRLGIAARLAACLTDHRDPTRIDHMLVEMLRLRLIKIAARVVEGAARSRIWLPTACPDAAMFRLLADRFAAAGP